MAKLVGASFRALKKVAGSIPGQGTCLGCGFDPWLGAHRRQPADVSLHIDIFLSLSLSLKIIETCLWVRIKK